MTHRQTFITLLDQIRGSLKTMAAEGWRGFDCSPETLERLARLDRVPRPRAESLEAIRADLGDCRRCGLSATRRNIVFGAGSPKARLVFVGEGPGRDEDLSGQPFVGAAGQLLTNIIQAIQLDRESVYICNVIKCRPPGNRNPDDEEIAACSPFLGRQIAAIQPEFVCTLGTFAAQTLLQTRQPVSRLRGRFHPLGQARLLATYHPAYLLRNPAQKRVVWNDMKLLMKAMGIAPPEAKPKP